MIFYSISRQSLQHIRKKVKLVILISQKHKLRQSIKMTARCCRERIAQWELGLLLILLFSALVRLLCAAARILSCNDEIFQFCLKSLEFLLTLLSSHSILCSCLYQPRVLFSAHRYGILTGSRFPSQTDPCRSTVEGDT